MNRKYRLKVHRLCELLRIYLLSLQLMGLCKVNCVPFYFLDSTLGRPFLWSIFTILSHFHGRITKNCLCLSPCSCRPSLRGVRDVFRLSPGARVTVLTGVTTESFPRGSAGTTWWASAWWLGQGHKGPKERSDEETGSHLWLGNGWRADWAQSLPSSGLDQVQDPPWPLGRVALAR